MKNIKQFLGLAMLLIGGVTQVLAQNTGINTKDPGSNLTVNGSFAANYKIVTASTTLGITDNFVAYNGSADGTITLPVAISGTGNFKGRTYNIKNTGNAVLTVRPSGSEQIDGSANVSSVIVPAGYYVELISKGTTTGTTWELSMLVTTTIPTTTQLIAIRLATPENALATPTLFVGSSSYSDIPGSISTFTLPAAKPIFFNFTLGLDDLSPDASSATPYFRCELYIDNNPSGLFQIVQQIAVGKQLQFNFSGVRSVSQGSHTISVKIIRWYDNGQPAATNQDFGVLSLVLGAVYIN